MARPESRYLNRELTWLEFNQRVLEEAEDKSVPLLERLKFLAITDSNMNEFFMVRVGGLRMLVQEHVKTRDPAGMTPREQFNAVSRRAHRMVTEQHRTFLKELEPGLLKHGIKRVLPEKLSSSQTRHVRQLFEEETSAVLSPMAVSLKHRFPLLAGLQLHMLVKLAPETGSRQPRFAVIPLGTALDRFIVLPSDSGFQYMMLEDAVATFVDQLFPGERVLECRVFRITRNANMSVEEDGAADLLSGMKEILEARKTSGCVRLEIQSGATKATLSFIQRALQVNAEDTYHISGPIDLGAFMKIATMDGFDHLQYETWTPQPSPQIDARKSMFAVLSKRDVLLSHPYDSFEPVIRLMEEAADDPNVLAIKQTLYRTSSNSPVIAALRRAAQNGKHVTVIVELKARFDEARNIGWAERLEHEGVQVIYGVRGLKTHSKLLIIVRREARGIVRYMHFGTGNYNEKTARLYSDISYMTSDDGLGTDASAFFNAITGYSAPQRFLKLDMAPIGIRDRLLEMIASEIERKRQGQSALIMAKMNSLVDTPLIDALYEASQAGVKVLLNVRGICCLRPGVSGLSENITVVSVVDRFLEHSRIFYFEHGGEEKVYISSADWMPRNLDRRAELMVPVDDEASRRKLVHILDVYFQDTVKGKLQLPDGRYRALRTRSKDGGVRSQKQFYREACDGVAHEKQSTRTEFEPHVPSGSHG